MLFLMYHDGPDPSIANRRILSVFLRKVSGSALFAPHAAEYQDRTIENSSFLSVELHNAR